MTRYGSTKSIIIAQRPAPARAYAVRTPDGGVEIRHTSEETVCVANYGPQTAVMNALLTLRNGGTLCRAAGS